jgi:hypothetical protein
MAVTKVGKKQPVFDQSFQVILAIFSSNLWTFIPQEIL